MSQSVHTNLKPKTPFEAGYKAYIETALRLVTHEINEKHYANEFQCDNLQAMKIQLQNAMYNVYQIENKDIDIPIKKEIIISQARYNFGGKAD